MNQALPWTAAVAAGKTVLVVTAFFVLFKVACGFAVWIRAFRVLARQKVPKPPILTAFEDLVRTDTHRIGLPHEEKWGGIVWVHLLHYHMVMVSEPRMITQALDRQIYPDSIDKPPLYSMINQGTASPPTASLVTAGTGDKFWRLVRKGVAPAFAQGNVKAASETSIAMAYRLADTLAAHGAREPLDIDAALQSQAFDVIGNFGFGKDFKATMSLYGEGAQACKCLSEAMMMAIRRMMRPDTGIPFTPAWRRYNIHQKKLLSIFRNLMKEVQARGQPAPEDQSIVAYLQRIRCEDGSPLPELRFWSELSIFFFAGVETTGHTLGFVLYFISQHPHVEAKIVQELQQHGIYSDDAAKPPRLLTAADLTKLSYLHCVIKETQRLMPVVPLVARSAEKDVKLGDTLVPKGSVIITHFLAMHTSERYWERPKDFIPERWIDPDCEYARPIDPSSSYVPTGSADIYAASKPAKAMNGLGPSVRVSCTQEGMDGPDPSSPFTYKGERVRRYMPYAQGSRGCIGMPQARVTMQATLAALLSRFSFRLDEKMGSAEDIRKAEVFRITVSLQDGLWMYAVPRHPAQKVPVTTNGHAMA